MLLALLLVPAIAGPLAAAALLWAPWFEARPPFAALFGHRPAVVLEPDAWQALHGTDVLILLSAVATVVLVGVVWSGRWVLWTAAAATAAVGATACVIGRNAPPRPGPGIYTDPDVAYRATAVPIVAAGCFVVAVLALMGYALAASRLSRRPAGA